MSLFSKTVNSLDSVTLCPLPPMPTGSTLCQTELQCNIFAIAYPSVSIADLPNELLLRIFDFLDFGYHDSLIPAAPVHTPHIDAKDEIRLREDLRSTSVFPQSQASVSKRWCNILCSVSHFWTRIIICLDIPGCVSFARRQIEASRLLPISIAVTTRNMDVYSDHPDQEQDISRKIIHLISPHIARCTSVVFDVTHSSSLPRLAIDFQDIAPSLEELRLWSRASKRLPGFKDGRTPLCFPFPNLKKIEIDGWNLVDIYTTNSSWIQQLIRGAVIFGVSHYTPDHEERLQDGFTVNDILGPLPDDGQLYSFTLDDVDFNSIVDEDYEGATNYCVEFIHLSRLGSDLTSNVLRFFDDPAALTIDRCSLSAATRFPQAIELSLVDIGDPDFSPQLQNLLAEWYNGEKLVIMGCPGFDDEAVRMLGMASEIDELNCPQLTSLNIVDCGGFSFDALRHMIANRTELLIEDNFEHGVGSFHLSIKGRIPDADDADRAWFTGGGPTWPRREKNVISGEMTANSMYLDWNIGDLQLSRFEELKDNLDDNNGYYY